MKALILSDEINQFHWSMLKAILLILSILPISQGILYLWHATEGSSQIMVGFFALSLVSSLLILSFWSALQATVVDLKDIVMTSFEQSIFKIYRYFPMSLLAVIVSYVTVSY